MQLSILYYIILQKELAFLELLSLVIVFVCHLLEISPLQHGAHVHNPMAGRRSYSNF